MRKAVLYIGMSLDGFIADTNGQVDWLGGHSEKPVEDSGYSDFIKNVDTVLMGSTTYNQVTRELSPDSWPYEGLETFVFSRKKQSSPHATFVDENLEDFVVSLKGKQGKNIWISGGASIANQLIKSRLVDIFHITIMPTILGNGIPLFSNGNPQTLLYHDKTIEIDGMVNIIYHKR